MKASFFTAEAAALLDGGDNRLVFDHQLVAEGAEPVFMLPGGGAQYAGVARGLYQTEPVFREWMDRGLDHMAQAHGTDLRALWLPEPGAEAEADRRLLQPSLQLPLLMILLAKIGVVTGSYLKRVRKYSIVIILIVAAIITPGPDVISQMTVAIPLFLLYEVSIVLTRRIEKREAAEEAKEWS